MNAVIAHHYWGRPGGGQLVAASTAITFNKLNYNTYLVGSTKFDAKNYLYWFGIDLTGFKQIYTLPIDLKAFGLYMRLIIWKTLLKTIKKIRADIVWTDESTYKPLFDKIKKDFKFIEYIHFPIEVAFKEEFKNSGLYYGEDPYIMEKYSKFPLNIYFKIYTKLHTKFLRKNPFEYSDIVLTNSKWTAEICKKVYGEKPFVLNPPISKNVKIIEKPPSFEERENIIVMLGRFSPEKRYHWVITSIIPVLKKNIRDAKIVIFGGAKTPTAITYLRQIDVLAKKNGLKVSYNINKVADVYLIPDAPREIINNIMLRAKVFLHATINEHWGIVIAEAMANGLPVIAHKSGGAWSDLLEEGQISLGYENEEEAVNSIIKIITNKKLWTKISFKEINKAKNLIFEKYIEKFKQFLEKI